MLALQPLFKVQARIDMRLGISDGGSDPATIIRRTTGQNTTPSMQNVIIQRVESVAHLGEFRSMMRAYLEWLGEDLGFQGVERELSSLPGAYAAQEGGCMLLARYVEEDISPADTTAGLVIGAVAFRALSGYHDPALDCVAGLPVHHLCEMKRLFVLPEHQGRGAGTALTQAIVREAGAAGYKAMVLDTLDRLEGANKLYRSQGFRPCERYNDCPLEGVLYFVKQLD